jgi:hypothetical protein
MVADQVVAGRLAVRFVEALGRQQTERAESVVDADDYDAALLDEGRRIVLAGAAQAPVPTAAVNPDHDRTLG